MCTQNYNGQSAVVRGLKNLFRQWNCTFANRAMVNVEKFRLLCLSLYGAYEQPHFHKVSFRVRKKIFATLDLERHTTTLKLTADQQAHFIEQWPNAVSAVSGAWGKQGWTIFELDRLLESHLLEALHSAYLNVSGGK